MYDNCRTQLKLCPVFFKGSKMRIQPVQGSGMGIWSAGALVSHSGIDPFDVAGECFTTAGSQAAACGRLGSGGAYWQPTTGEGQSSQPSVC